MYYIIEWTEKASKKFAIIKAENQTKAIARWSAKTTLSVYDRIESFDGKPPFIYFMMCSLVIE